MWLIIKKDSLTQIWKTNVSTAIKIVTLLSNSRKNWTIVITSVGLLCNLQLMPQH
jgi:hypothetical protein